MNAVKWLAVIFVICVVLTCCGAPAAWSLSAFKSELMTRLEGGVLGLGPVRAVAQDAGCEIVSANDRELTIKFAGRTNNVAVIGAMGDIAIRSARELKSLEEVDQLYADLVNTYNFIAKVSSSIPDDVKFGCLYFNVKFRLSNPKVLKRIVFPKANYEGNIIVPECKVRQARLVILPTPSSGGRVTLRNQRIYDDWWGPPRETKTVDATREIVFGSHQFKFESSAGSVALEAITDPTPNLIYYQGGGLENVITTAALPLSGSAAPPSEELTPADTASDIPEGTTYVIPVDSRKMQELVDQIREDAAGAENPDKPRKVAILDFELIPRKSGTQIDRVVARNVREDLSTAMSAVKCFKVLERSQLAQALKNLKLDQTGIIDSDTAKKLGKMVSADYVLVGSVSDRGDKVVVQARMIDAEKGETTYTARVEMRRTGPKAEQEGEPSSAPKGKSLDQIEQAIAANPNSADAYADLALYWDTNNDPGRCASAISKAIHLDPDRFAASSMVYDKLAPVVQRRGDMLAPTVRLVSISGGRTAGIEDKSSVSSRDDSLAIETIDDTGIAKIELYFNDSPFPRGTWPLQGRRAALIKLKTPWIDKSAAGPKTAITIKAVDTASRKGEQKLTLRVTR